MRLPCRYNIGRNLFSLKKEIEKKPQKFKRSYCRVTSVWEATGTYGTDIRTDKNKYQELTYFEELAFLTTQ